MTYDDPFAPMARFHDVYDRPGDDPYLEVDHDPYDDLEQGPVGRHLTVVASGPALGLTVGPPGGAGAPVDDEPGGESEPWSAAAFGHFLHIQRRLLDAEGLDALPPPDPLITGILTRDTVAALYGAPGTGKSFVALDWACSIAAGAWWQGRKVHQGPVLYVCAEGSAGMRARKQAWEKSANVILAGFPIRWLPLPVNFLDPEWVDPLGQTVEDLGCVLVVIDTLNRSMPGGDENRSSDMGKVIAAADRVRQASHATVLLVHHSPKETDTLRGHSSLEGALETVISVHRDGSKITLKNPKQKDAAEFPPIHLTLTEVGDSCAFLSQNAVGQDDERTGSEAVLAELIWNCCGTTGLPTSELLKMAELPKTSFYRALNRLLTKGAVVNVGTAARPRIAPKHAGPK